MFGGATPSPRRSPGSRARPANVQEDPEDPNTVQCWASRVHAYSSQYNNGGWAADQVVGLPRVYPRYGDIQGSWAQGNKSDDEWIELDYPEPIYIQNIHIYETYHCGAVTKVEVFNSLTNTYKTVYEAEPTVIGQSRILEVDLEECLNFPSSRVRIELDCTASGSWTELDAACIIGKRNNLPDSPPDTLCEDFGNLVNNPLFSDVCFEVEGREVHAHKAILMVRSEYFKAMFGSNMEESSKSVIPLHGVMHDVFVSLLEYIYTGKITCSPATSVDLLKLADMYSLEPLKRICMLRIPKLLSVDNVIETLSSLAHNEGLADVQKLCYTFIAKHFDKVAKSEAFCKLPQEQLLEIVQMTASKLTLS